MSKMFCFNMYGLSKGKKLVFGVTTATQCYNEMYVFFEYTLSKITKFFILQEFPGDSYITHTSCISENEKYGGKGWQEKPNANKVLIGNFQFIGPSNYN